MRRALPHLAILFVLFAALAGCTLRQAAARTSAILLDDMVAAMNAETDTALAREAAATLFVMLEGFVRADPENRHLRRMAAQVYGGFTFGFLEKSEPERARRLYLRGRDHGLAGLRALPGLGRALAGDLAGLRRALARLDRGDLPLLFWTTYCWSGWINLSRNDPDALADLSRVEAMMARALELGRGYYYGGPDLFFGVYLGGRSRLLGGDPEKAKAHFERAIAAAKERFLMSKVLYARHYAVQVQDRALFLRLLKEVETAPPGLLPEQALANTLARARAAALRKEVEDLF